MQRTQWILAAVGAAGFTMGTMAQTPATRSNAAPRTANAPASTMPVNIDRRLQDLITLDADRAPLAEFVNALRTITRTNITVNWNALTAAGVTRDVPVTIHVKDVTYEAAVRAVMECLPGEKGGGVNYTVGDNILDITSNAELGKGAQTRVRNVDRVISYGMNGNASPDERAANIKVLEQVLMGELRRAGEPMDAKGHSLLLRDLNLVVNVSDRGMAVIDRAGANFTAPVKLGQIAGGTQLTAQAKRAAEAMKAAGISEDTLVAVAREPAKYQGKISMALMAGTAEELAKEKPSIGGAITDGGILLVGPRDAIRARTMLVVYDIRDLVRRIAAKSKANPTPTPAELQSAVVAVIQQTLKPDGDGSWGTLEALEKSPHATVLHAYNGLLIVFATPQTHRMINAAMQDMAK